MDSRERAIRRDEILNVLVMMEASNQAVPRGTKNYAVDLIAGFTGQIRQRLKELNEVDGDGIEAKVEGAAGRDGGVGAECGVRGQGNENPGPLE